MIIWTLIMEMELKLLLDAVLHWWASSGTLVDQVTNARQAWETIVKNFDSKLYFLG